MDDKLFLEELSKHPALRKRMEKILSVAVDINDRKIILIMIEAFTCYHRFFKNVLAELTEVRADNINALQKQGAVQTVLSQKPF